jgi:hypothetical protein
MPYESEIILHDVQRSFLNLDLLLLFNLLVLGSSLSSSFNDDLLLLHLSLLLLATNGECLLFQHDFILLIHVHVTVPKHQLSNRLDTFGNPTQETL